MSRSIATAYRRALRCYPSSWRARHEEETLGVLLDVAEAQGRDRSDPGELLALVREGVRTRIDRMLPADFRRFVSTVALAVGVAYAVVQAVTTVLERHIVFGSYPTDESWRQQFDLTVTACALFAFCWIMTLAAAATNARRSRGVYLLALGGGLLTALVLQRTHVLTQLTPSVVFEAVLLTLTAAARPVTGRPLAIAIVAALAGCAVCAIGGGNVTAFGMFWFWAAGPFDSAAIGLALAGACLAAATAANVGWLVPARWMLAATVPWVPMLAALLVTDPLHYFEWPYPLYTSSIVVLGYALAIWRIRRAQPPSIQDERTLPRSERG